MVCQDPEFGGHVERRFASRPDALKLREDEFDRALIGWRGAVAYALQPLVTRVAQRTPSDA
jgi:hypothetical protein